MGALADRTGLKVAQLRCLAVRALLGYADAHQGRLHLPLDFATQWNRKTPTR